MKSRLFRPIVTQKAAAGRWLPAALLVLVATLALGGCVTTPTKNSAAVAPATPSRLAEQLHEILHRLDDTGAHVSARVVDLQTGQDIYNHDSARGMIPASNMKIIVTATALDFFGPEHSFNTELAMQGKDLWVIGSGDPAVGDPGIARKQGRSVTSVFDDWADALIARGNTHILGNVYYDDTALDSERVHPSWDKDDLPHWYAAPVGGLNFNDNCVDITITPAAEGEPAMTTVMPPVQFIRINNRTESGSDKDATISRAFDADVFNISGGCVKPTVLKSKPVTNPSTFFIDAMRTHFATRGITIAGGTKSLDDWKRENPLLQRLATGIKREGVATHKTTLVNMIARINKPSQNLLAEGLCKMTGRAYYARQNKTVRGGWRHGEVAARAFIKKLGLDSDDLDLADGSGLSRKNRVTTRMISGILTAMHQHEHGEIFRNSLAIGGVDGTIASRFKDIPNRIYAKTGYIGGVRSLSGYVHTKDDRWIAFSMIYNNIPGTVRPYQDLQDEAVMAIFNSSPADLNEQSILETSSRQSP